MTKKIILGIVIAIIILFMATSLLYANVKDIHSNGINTQNIDKEKVFHVIANSNYGGSISPKGNQSVIEGNNLTFNIIKQPGYELEWLRVDNIKYKNYSSSIYTFTDISKNHTIQAHFKKIKS